MSAFHNCNGSVVMWKFPTVSGRSMVYSVTILFAATGPEQGTESSHATIAACPGALIYYFKWTVIVTKRRRLISAAPLQRLNGCEALGLNHTGNFLGRCVYPHLPVSTYLRLIWLTEIAVSIRDWINTMQIWDRCKHIPTAAVLCMVVRLRHNDRWV